MSAIKLSTPSSGSISLSPADTASNLTITVPAVTGTMATVGPAFSAYQSSGQTLSSSTITKIQLQTEEFDTNNCFDSTTNYRFTPNVAGYYQVSAHIQPNASYTAGIVAIYKNGSLYKYGAYNANATGVSQGVVTCLVYLNGSTDYVEFYASFQDGQAASATSAFTWFQGCMVRSA